MNIKRLSISSLGFAFIFLLTMIKVNIAVVGYVHIGDVGILVMSSILPSGLSAIVAGLSSALVDVVSGYGNYAIASLLVKGLLGFVLSTLLKSDDTKKGRLFLATWLIIVGGYSLWDFIQFQSLEYVLVSLAANTVQVVVSFIIFNIVYKKIRLTLKKKKV